VASKGARPTAAAGQPILYCAAVAHFLSPEWLADLDRAAAESPGLTAATADVALVVQQNVIDGPEGDQSWHVTVDHGKVRVEPGPAAQPDVTFTQDHATAVAVGTGQLSAQAAFMLGKLRVGGTVGLLVQHRDAFDGLDDVFAEVRAGTDY
jgi:putative sterol carrier protein